jgi:hypothetical protein
MDSTEELSRLSGAISSTGDLPGNRLIVWFRVHCAQDCWPVIEKAKDVLRATIEEQQRSETWPSLEEWQVRLPRWFVERCAEEILMEEAERRRRLPMEERIRLGKEWSLNGWLYWLHPDRRSWFWWTAEPGTAEARVALVVDGWPFPWGSLDWLLRAAGAISVEPEEN